MSAQSRPAVLVTYPDAYLRTEAVALVEAAEFEVKRVVMQAFLQRAKYGIGTGKAEELRRAVEELQAEAVVFDESLKSTQIYNLAKLTGVEVIDREKLILDIFRRRATTAEAKLQVQLAELRYEIPRAREKVRLAKSGEQPGFFGLGKYDVDVYHRDVRRRLATVAEKLRHASRRRELHRAQRERANIPTLSLAGYTGAGKTTLFNLLAGERKEVARGVFTTLTTVTRAISVSGAKVLLTDTVGFISRLPTYMIEAFKSTLEELTYATLVLLVVDLSEPPSELQRRFDSCVQTLAQLEVSPARVFLLLNKADVVPPDAVVPRVTMLQAEPRLSAVVSAKTGEGIDELRRKLHELIFEYQESRFTLRPEEVPRVAGELDWLKQNAAVEIIQGADGTVRGLIRGPHWVVDRFAAARAPPASPSDA
jgi:GTP-binding protein HflX